LKNDFVEKKIKIKINFFGRKNNLFFVENKKKNLIIKNEHAC